MKAKLQFLLSLLIEIRLRLKFKLNKKCFYQFSSLQWNVFFTRSSNLQNAGICNGIPVVYGINIGIFALAFHAFIKIGDELFEIIGVLFIEH